MLFSFYGSNIKPVSYLGATMPKKDLVQNVNQVMSITMDLRETINSVSGAGDAETALSGNAGMSKSVTNFLGSSFGFKKAIRSEGSRSFPATASSKSSKSKIIGFTDRLRPATISPKSSTSSTTALILERVTALFPS